MSRYSDHVKKWKDCELCELCNYRKRVVFSRGKIPCEVLYIAESPGDSENNLGRQPLIGPAGLLLDSLSNHAERVAGYEPRQAYFNLVGCFPKIPKLVDGREKKVKREPNKEEIEACSDRLKEFYEIAKPQAIVSLGALSHKWVPKILGHNESWTVNMMHPAGILKAPISQKGLAIQRCEVQLADLFSSLKAIR